MKICHIADFFPGFHRIAGGAEYAAMRLIEEQIRLGSETSLVTTVNDFRPEAPFKGAGHFQINFLDRIIPARLAFAVKQLFLPFDPVAWFGIYSVLKKLRPDVVHIHNVHFLSLAAVHTAGLLRIPVVFSVYDYWILCPNFMLFTPEFAICRKGQGSWCAECTGAGVVPFFHPVKKLFYGLRRNLIKVLMNNVRKFVVLSSASATLLALHGISRDKITVIPQYIDKKALFEPEPAKTVRHVLLYAGWIERRKGLNVIVEALSLLSGKYPGLVLDVAGSVAEPAYKKGIEDFIAERSLTDRVRFLGPLGQKELHEKIRNSFLVVVPEQWENMSPVILTETMALGKCALASKTGGIPGFIEDFKTGLMAKRSSASGFADKIDWAIGNMDEVHRIGIRARAAARCHFGYGKINRDVLSLYCRLIKQSKTKLA